MLVDNKMKELFLVIASLSEVKYASDFMQIKKVSN